MNSSLRWGERPATASSWENVLLQMTLAFMIILGYLLSDDEAVMATQERALDGAAKAIEKVKQTPTGKDAQGRVAAETNEQLLKLLNAWLRLRGERPLVHALAVFEDAARVQLDADAAFLPRDGEFDKLRAEIERVFRPTEPTGLDDRITTEVARLLERTCREAALKLPAEGIDPARLAQSALAAHVQQGAAQMHFDADTASQANLGNLAAQIRTDLKAQYRDVRRLQYELVGRIAESRVLASGDAGDEVDVGRVLRNLIDELHGPIGLLPEVRDRLLATRIR